MFDTRACQIGYALDVMRFRPPSEIAPFAASMAGGYHTIFRATALLPPEEEPDELNAWLPFENATESEVR